MGSLFRRSEIIMTHSRIFAELNDGNKDNTAIIKFLLGRVEQNQHVKNIGIYQQLLKYAQNNEDLKNDANINLAQNYLNLGEQQTTETILSNMPREFLTYALLACNSLHDSNASPEKIFKFHTDLGKAITQSSPRFYLNLNDKTRDRKLNIGIVIDPLRTTHVVYRFMASYLVLDSSQYQITFYDCGKVQYPETIRLLEKLNHKIVIAKNFQPVELAKQIRNDKIDVLFDLSSYLCFPSAEMRMSVFASHPAPVQISCIAYPNTTGLPRMDYRFVDHITDPEEKTDPFYTEKLLRFNKSFLCFLPNENELMQKIDEALPSERKGYITLGIMNDPRKFSNGFLIDLCNMLKKIPKSKLYFQYGYLWESVDNCEYLLKRLEKLSGIDLKELKSRVEFASIFEARIEEISQEVDIAVDTYPYNGTTTNFDILLACVPIVTRTVDQRHEANVSASILTNLEIPELKNCITHNSIDFVQSVIELSKKSELRRSLREKGRMRLQLLKSPLCDFKGYGQNLWQLVRETWHHFCDKDLRDQIELQNKQFWERLPDEDFNFSHQHSLSNDEMYNICLLAILDNKPKTLIHIFNSIDREYLIDILEVLFILKIENLINALIESSAIFRLNDTVILSNDAKMMQELLQNEIYLKKMNISDFDSLIKKALSLDSRNILKELMNSGKVDAKNHIHDAVRDGKLELVKFLFEQKVDFTVLNDQGEGPIHLAVKQDNEMMRFFISNKLTLDLRMKNEPFFSPISLAASLGNDDLVAELLRAGAHYPPSSDEWMNLELGAIIILQEAYKNLKNSTRLFENNKPVSLPVIPEKSENFSAVFPI